MIDSSLPFIDLHRHLDGNIRPNTVLELGRKNNIDLPAQTLEELLPHIQITSEAPDLISFLKKLDWGVAVLKSYEDCRRVAYENVEDASKEGIDYIELRFSPGYMAMSHQLSCQGVVEAVIDGVKAGSHDLGVKTNLIGTMSRTFGQTACRKELTACLAYKDQLVAMDLAGDELGKPSQLFEEHFMAIRNAGLAITIHAGEAAGAQSIWHAVNTLGATRIGHGVKAIEDEKLMDYLAHNDIAIESCLTSNIQTSTCKDLSTHPAKKFLDKGIKVTLNTDDPAVEGITLPYEYEVAAPKAGFNQADITHCQKNSVQSAFLSDAEKKHLYTIKK